MAFVDNNTIYVCNMQIIEKQTKEIVATHKETLTGLPKAVKINKDYELQIIEADWDGPRYLYLTISVIPEEENIEIELPLNKKITTETENFEIIAELNREQDYSNLALY